MKTKSRNLLIGVLLMIAMLFGVFAITPLTASAATSTAVWWTNASDMTDFTASFDSERISSRDWYKLMKYDEARGFYAQVSDSSGYVGTNTKLDFEEVIRRSGNGKYKVAIETTSGVEYESAEKTYTFVGALDAPKNLRWDGEIVRWGAVDGADNYDVCLYYKKEGETRFRPWSSAWIQSPKTSCDFTGQLSNPGTYYFTVDAISNDKTISISSSKSAEKTVAYTYSKLNAHFGNVNNDEKKYTLYWDESPDATGYYMVFSKKNGEEYQPVTGVDNKLSKVTKLDLYAVMEANGEGDYKAEFFAFNTSPTIPVSNEASVEITFTICEHSYTKEIQTSDYLHSGSISCTAKTKYYYACEHCGEAAPKEAQYVYEGAIGEHDFSAGYQADGKMHWRSCSKCDYAEYQSHTLDANNYCATCDTTVYNVWLGDIQITSKNCDDITGDGSAFYIPEQNRLFLTNYTDDGNNRKGITVIDPDNGDDYVAMIYAKNGLNLYIRGENFLYEDEGDIGRQYAVYVKSGDLKIDGTGSLYTNASTGFYTVDGDIYIDKSGGLLEVVARYAFRCAEHKFYISNGTVKARSYTGYVYTSAPVLDNYSCYYAEIADNYDMNNPTAFEPITNVKYFYIEPAYMVTIEPFECEGDYITEVLRYGAEYTLPACPYTAPDGKTFYKWGVTPLGNMYEAGVKITITENVELMPMWQAIKASSLTATYSGTILAGNKITPANISITLTYNDSSTQPVNAGDVEYWYGDVQITDPENYVFGTELIGDVNVTVKYAGLETTMTVKVVGHEITFNANGGTGEMAKAEYVGEYTLPDCTFSAPTGKQFKAWSVGGVEKAAGDKITVTANTTVTAVWEDIPVVTYTVSFDANGGTGTMTDVTNVSGEYTLPANGFTAPDGKQFKSWSVGGSEKAVGDKITVTANTTVTAVWEDIPVVTYTVSFDANGGTGTMTDVTNVSGEYTLPANGFTAPDGKQFKSWSVGGSEKAVGDKITVTANTTVTAVWEDIPVVTYTVSFDSNGGTGSMADVTGVSGEYTLPANGFTAPDGKQFKAWSVGGVEKAAGDKITVTANTTVTAVWENIPAATYKVTVTNGTGGGNYAAGATVSITANEASTGEMFDKWEVVSGSITLADANSATTTFVMPAGAVSVKATYKEAPHTHSYGSEWKTDADKHWHECSCGDKSEEAAHTAGDWITDTAATATTDGTKHKECTVCGYVMENGMIPATGIEHTHNYSSDWKADADEHWNECECGDKANKAAHADENNDGKCDICDYAMGNADNPGGDKESEKTGLSGGAIAGIAVGSVAVAGVGGFSLFWFVIKKKKFADLIALFKKK